MNKKNVIKKTACYLLSGLTVLSSGGNFLAQGTVDDSIKPGTVQNVKPKGKKSSVPLAPGSTAAGIVLGLLGGYGIFGRNKVPANKVPANKVPANEGYPDLSLKLETLYNPPLGAFKPKNPNPQEFAKVRDLYEANPNVNVGENFYISSINHNLPKNPSDGNRHITQFQLVAKDSLTAGMDLAKEYNVNLTEYHDVAVLNFGNAQRPGGSVALTGPTAQEESLCCSTLLFYALTKAWHDNIFYTNNLILRGAIDKPWKKNVECQSQRDFDTHRESIANHGIFSSHVPILRNNSGRLSISDQHMNFLTFAAPKVSEDLYDKSKGTWVGDPKLKVALSNVMYCMFVNIYFGAAYYGIKKLVIGAIGCGAFNCDPDVVAEAARKAWDKHKDTLNAFFDEIVIAVKTKSPSKDKNYRAFAQQFNDLINPRQQAYNGGQVYEGF